MKTFSKTLLLTSIVAAMAFTGCKKDETPEPTPTPTPIPAASLASLNAFFTSNGAQTQTFTINNNSLQTITGSRGTMVGFAANSFVTLAGAPVTGNVTIELREIYDKKNMLLSNITTNAEQFPSGPQAPLISGGEFYVHATQGNATLKLAPGVTYSVFLPSAATPSPAMSLFDGTITPSGIQWGPNLDSNTAISPSSAPLGYFAYCDSLDWGNADQFFNNPTYTSIHVNVSGTFDPAQIKAYVWYDNVNGVWSFGNAFNSTTNIYSDNHTGTGVPLHIVVISVQNGLLYTGIVSGTATGNDVFNVTLTQTTEAAFTATLSTLP
ncbi:MAG: hypothetical protein ABIQ40_01590 [Bacteroidia bacterium]